MNLLHKLWTIVNGDLFRKNKEYNFKHPKLGDICVFETGKNSGYCEIPLPSDSVLIINKIPNLLTNEDIGLCHMIKIDPLHFANTKLKDKYKFTSINLIEVVESKSPKQQFKFSGIVETGEEIEVSA